MSPRWSPASSSAALNAAAASASWLSGRWRPKALVPMPTIAALSRSALRHQVGSASKNSTRRAFCSLPVVVSGSVAGADEAKFPRHLVGGQVLGAMRDEAFRRGRGAVARHDDGGDPLVALRVRQADHVGELHGRHLRQHRLDLRRRDVDAAGLDHLLQPPAEVEEAVRVQQPEVAGAEPAVVEALRVERGVLVVAAGDVAPDQNFADRACRQRLQAFRGRRCGSPCPAAPGPRC